MIATYSTLPDLLENEVIPALYPYVFKDDFDLEAFADDHVMYDEVTHEYFLPLTAVQFWEIIPEYDMTAANER